MGRCRTVGRVQKIISTDGLTIEMPEEKRAPKVVFHVRPWEVGLYTALESCFSNSLGANTQFLYITHHFEANNQLKKRGKESININAELSKIPVPEDWRLCLQDLEDRCLGKCRNFHQYLAAERHLMAKPADYKIKQLYRTAIFFDTFFAEHKPFFMLSNGPDHMAFWLAMDILRAHGGHACGLVPTSWPRYHFSMLSTVGNIYYGERLYKEFLERGLGPEERVKAAAAQDALLSGKAEPINISDERLSLVTKRSLGRRCKSRMKLLYWQSIERGRGNWHVPTYPLPGRFLIEECRAKARSSIRNHYFNDNVPAAPFVFFPLHLEPEATTQVYSNFYEDQLQVIQSLSKALPVSWMLAVKEHPNMKNKRSLSFYKTLDRMPNVALIRSDEPSWKLIKDCCLVATLSGTSGLEASVIGKPVLVFGEPGWGYSPTVTQVQSMHDLHKTILETYKSGLPANDERVQAFVLSWLRANPDGIYDHFPWLAPIDSSENIEAIGNALKRLLSHLLEDQPANKEDVSKRRYAQLL